MTDVMKPPVEKSPLPGKPVLATEQEAREVAEAAREVKTLELLRQRRAEKFRLWQNAEEQKFIDEIGQRKFTRRGGRQ